MRWSVSFGGSWLNRRRRRVLSSAPREANRSRDSASTSSFAVITGHLRDEHSAARRIGPHVFRHTTAVHLLEAGVEVNVIRG
jgi:site-specific recombinase XerD